MNITSDIKYLGVNDHEIDLFEGMYEVPKGMAYNSYAILDEKIAIIDTVDVEFKEQWLSMVRQVLGERKPDYLIVQHMEPDHSANILSLVTCYPEIILVATAKAFQMMKNYFGTEFTDKRRIVTDGDTLALGNHNLTFIAAPMVHWPEVMVTYDAQDKVLFTADAFGKFGANDVKDEWVHEARRYYFGIVGKYGLFVQKLFQKINDFEIQKICPLHGPILSENIGYYLDLYNKWSSYEPEEEDGIIIAYTSVYGNTKKAALLLAQKLKEKGCEKIIVHDLARCDMTEAVADAFRFNKLVLATTTYNAELFPFMREFISSLTERNFCNRKIGFIENGGWAPIAAKLMRERLEKCNDVSFAENTVRILSAMNKENVAQMDALVEELV
ncbi:MAG: FprA family A-type flavoprotein [Lachnospiraceae bacterium]|nr:FprA family A-type flavoprotein [Lachnospiraceae bacterium]